MHTMHVALPSSLPPHLMIPSGHAPPEPRPRHLGLPAHPSELYPLSALQPAESAYSFDELESPVTESVWLSPVEEDIPEDAFKDETGKDGSGTGRLVLDQSMPTLEQKKDGGSLILPSQVYNKSSFVDSICLTSTCVSWRLRTIPKPQ